MTNPEAPLEQLGARLREVAVAANIPLRHCLGNVVKLFADDERLVERDRP